MAKAGREKIRLNSSAGTGHFYTTTKNKRKTPGKLEMMKFDPVARKHVIYKEGKIKKSCCAAASSLRPDMFKTRAKSRVFLFGRM